MDVLLASNTGLVILLCIGVAFLAAGMTFFIIRRRTMKRLDALRSALEQISGGDLSYRMTSAGQGDIAGLAASFNAMADRVAVLSADIAERNHAEAALQRSEATNRAIIDAIPDLLFRLSADGIFLDYKNPRGANLLAAPEFFLGRSLHDVLPPELADQTLHTLKSALQTGQPQGFEYQLAVDDTLRDFETRHVVIDEGEVLAIVRDITERKQQHELLQTALEREKELSELKSRFMTLMTHEFRTPLAVILTSSDLLERYRERLTDEMRSKHFTMIYEQVRHLTRVLDDILTLSRAETVGLQLQVAQVNLEAICKLAIEDMQPLLAEHELVFSCPDPCKTALLDSKLIRQAVSNLLSNAVKYSPPDSKIYFDLLCDDDKAMIRIRDCGIGIPEEDQKHLFNVFYRASNNDEKPGVGLGLAIVKHTANLHGGTIIAESEVGVGTTFTLTLPLSKREG